MRKASFEMKEVRKSFTEVREIVIESEAEARYEHNRKRLKMYDFAQSNYDNSIF